MGLGTLSFTAPTVRTVRAHHLVLDLGGTPARTGTGTVHLGLGPGFLPLPCLRLSAGVPVLGLFFEGALPLPSAMSTPS